MEFRVLGKLEVEAGGSDLTPHRPKQRALLAVLLLHADEVVPTDDLLDALWSDRPPATAQTALHGHVSALRKRLGADRIETRPPGYVLRLGAEDTVDLRRVECLVAEARANGPARRAEKLREALALFRGTPLADFRYDTFARNEAARLHELRASIREELFAAELELGRHDEVIPELEGLIAEDPLRERPRAQLMLALYRAGRQNDALHAYQEARRVLAAELGIEPGTVLRQLERQILNHDPELEAATPAGKPEGIVSFLFAEIAGERAEELDVVQAAIARHGGFGVEQRGGSRLVAFARARDAVAAAVDVQRAASEHSIAVRIGIHSAEAASVDDGYAGLDVDIASSICDAAHPGQVLFSQNTRDLLLETTGEAVVHDLGAHRLKDLRKPQRLFELAVPGIPSDARAPRGLGTRQTNLPLQATPLVGRRQEIREVVDLLTRSDTGVITLTGAGGTGKTRLAVHVAAELLDEFPDGVFFVDLAALSDPGLVVATIARTLGISERHGSSQADALARYLTPRRVLLVLDNFEQVLEAAPAVAGLCAPATGSAVLATSRAPLRIPAERIYPVLPLRAPGRADDAEQLRHVDSVTLFSSAASAVRPDFAITPENARPIAELCAALDGLPLAIELAAARVGVLPPAALLERLHRRLQLLTRTSEDVPRRHRALSAAIDWSYELLDPEQQRLFVRLAVFAGGCSLEAVEHVCGEGIAVVDALGALVDANMVRSVGTDAAPRFAMLETIRAYALERLGVSDDAEALRRRHAESFTALAEEAEQYLRDNPRDRLERLELEHDNLRAALDWLETSGERELQARLAGALWRFWYLAGHLTEGRGRLERAVSAEPRPAAARVKVLIGAAVMAINTSDVPTAKLRAAEALSLSRTVGDAWSAGYAGLMLASALAGEGDLDAARRLNEESIHALRELGDEHSALIGARNLAGNYASLGERDRARAQLEDNLSRATTLGNARIEASTLGALAMVALEQGRVEDAHAMLKQSLRLHLQLADMLDTAVDVCRSAFLLAFDGRAAVAARLVASFEALGEEMGSRRSAVAQLNAETVGTIGTQLDESAFADAWRQGQALTPDEAAALALASLD